MSRSTKIFAITLFVILLTGSIECQVTPRPIPLPYATVVGGSIYGVDFFNGIPYTQGGTKRFEASKPVDPKINKGTIPALTKGTICPQYVEKPRPGSIVNETTCLNLNIARPDGTKNDAKLPVMVWIYGGGFNDGEVDIYNPFKLVPYGASLGMPFVFVAMNYRLNAYGFLAGKQLKKRGVLNLGLRDQRLALEWVQSYISFFGGDPQKVTVFGESAGAISIGFHLIAYGGSKGNNLFRAAIMESGSPTSLAVPQPEYLQPVYDYLVNQTGCKASKDTFKCLQSVDPQKFQVAAASAGKFWFLRDTQPYAVVLDGTLIPDSPSTLLSTGKFVKVPVLTGENLDEGTFFVGHDSNSYPNDATVAYNFRSLTPNLPAGVQTKFMQLYPNDPSVGSPYGTGNRTYFSPQYKRIASMVGDLIFVSGRRFLIDVLSTNKIPTWTYLYEFVQDPSQINSTTYVGVAHSFEITSVYRAVDTQVSLDMAAYWISFANHLNPNAPNFPHWNRYSTSNLNQIRFANQGTKMSKDNYRREQSSLFNSNLRFIKR